MTPKEKAKDLFNKYYLFIDIKNYENTKACALIAVDELLNFTWYMPNRRQNDEWQYYWENVKQEIEAI